MSPVPPNRARILWSCPRFRPTSPARCSCHCIIQDLSSNIHSKLQLGDALLSFDRNESYNFPYNKIVIATTYQPLSRQVFPSSHSSPFCFSPSRSSIDQHGSTTIMDDPRSRTAAPATTTAADPNTTVWEDIRTGIRSRRGTWNTN